MEILIVAAIYFVPTMVAASRHHPSMAAIFVVNLLGAWTGILWLVALVWSLTGARAPPPQQIVIVQQQGVDPAAIQYLPPSAARGGSEPRGWVKALIPDRADRQANKATFDELRERAIAREAIYQEMREQAVRDGRLDS
jgi:Superinfection immunity protein